MRIALFLSALLLVTVIASGTALACECARSSPTQNFRNADLVFEGELMRATRLPSSSSFSLAYTFKVTRSLKGEIGDVVSIFGAGTECDASFVSDYRYRIYAKDDGGVLTSGACAGNDVIWLAGANTGRLVTRTFYSSPPPFEIARFFMKTLAVCALGVLLGSGVFAWRRYVLKSLPS